MMYAAIITLVLIIIGTVHVLYMMQKKLFKEIFITIILMSITLIYCYSYIFEWNLPGPSDFIAIIFKPLSKYIFGYNFK